VPAIAVLLVAVLTADLMVLMEMPTPGPGPAAADRRVAVRQEGARKGGSETGGYVASAGSQQITRPSVAPLRKLRRPHLFVAASRTIPASALRKVRALQGVAAVEVADAAEVTLAGKRVQTMGVDPSTFRAYTPRLTARSDRLWANLAGGEAAVSFVLGKDGGVGLGSTVDTGGRKLRIGAWATMGMGSINAVVSRQTARALGIPSGNALVISAPKVDSARLRLRLLKVLPKGSQVATINPVLVTPRGRTGQITPQATWPAGSLMSADQIRVALTAAVSKLGRPYVWGAEGPDSFDCSGLVQWAFAQAGVRMPRVTDQQWVTGPQIPLSQAQPGDLLFWRSDPTNPGYISHVAIYWGDGKMLHAPHTGDVVKLVPIYTANLAGVVRVSPQIAAQLR
jgi:cell wall-associated NlpC family hydrolase